MAKAKVLTPTTGIKTLAHAPAEAVEVDDILVIEGRVCVAYADTDAAEVGQFIYQADEVIGPKAAVEVKAGEAAYWTGTAFTNVESTNTPCGMFREAAASGDAEANLELSAVL